ncbi:MAG TPA: hypothetical protein VFR47_09630 [Anaerolineales bacterium]|nr:hypothetical protein [Anaerolineales bacterium]
MSNTHTTTQWVKFNLHNIVKFRVNASAATAPLFKDMFRPFLTDEDIQHFDLTISGELEPLQDGAFGEAHGETEFHYNAEGVHLDALEVQVFRTPEGGFRLNGNRELLVMALPLIDRLMVQKNAAMVHALTVEYKGHALLMPAWGGTGKTSTMSKLVEMEGFAFMGDDWAFVTKDANLLAYPKPMFIKPYHRSLYPHLFNKVRKPLVPVKLSKSIHSVTTLVHPYITKYPRLASMTRRWSPEHMMVAPQVAFPQARFSTAAPIAAALFVERFDSASTDPVFVEKDSRWMTSQLVGNFFSELPRQSRVVMTTLGASALSPIDQAFIEKSAVLNTALQGKCCFYLRVPQALAPDQASDMIVSHIQKVLEIAGVK